MISRKKASGGPSVDPESASEPTVKSDPPLLAPLLVVGALAFIALFAVARSLCGLRHARSKSEGALTAAAGEGPLEDPPLPASALAPPEPPASDRVAGGARGETVRLRGGLEMPAVGFGTCCRASARGAAVAEATRLYLKNGGKLVDTAMAYRNHKEIGEGLRAGGRARTRCGSRPRSRSGQVRGYDACVAAVENLVSELGVARVDLLLIHSPKLGEVKTVELWRGLIEAKRRGPRARDRRLELQLGRDRGARARDRRAARGEPDPVPPWTPAAWRSVAARGAARGVRDAHRIHGPRRRALRAASSTPRRPSRPRAHGATEAQVLLRWARQQGVAVIPGSSSEAHIVENLELPAFELSAAEVAAIEAAPAPRLVRRAQGAGQVRRTAAETAGGPR